MGKTLDLADWYTLLASPTYMESAENFLNEIDQLMISNGSTGQSQNVRDLHDLFEERFNECRALIGFVLAHRGQDVQFNKASLIAFDRHHIDDTMILLSWVGNDTKQQECKQRIREVCNGILRLVGSADVEW